MDIAELHSIHKHQEKLKAQVYRDVFGQCQKIIRKMAHKRQQFCWYFVPFIVFGKPLYNVDACICFIMYKLKKKGFEVLYYKPNLLYISWEVKKVPKYKKYLESISKGNVVTI